MGLLLKMDRGEILAWGGRNDDSRLRRNGIKYVFDMTSL